MTSVVLLLLLLPGTVTDWGGLPCWLKQVVPGLEIQIPAIQIHQWYKPVMFCSLDGWEAAVGCMGDNPGLNVLQRPASSRDGSIKADF